MKLTVWEAHANGSECVYYWNWFKRDKMKICWSANTDAVANFIYTRTRIHGRRIEYNQHIIVNIISIDWTQKEKWNANRHKRTVTHKNPTLDGCELWMLQIENSIRSIYFPNFTSLHQFMANFILFHFIFIPRNNILQWYNFLFPFSLKLRTEKSRNDGI